MTFCGEVECRCQQFAARAADDSCLLFRSSWPTSRVMCRQILKALRTKVVIPVSDAVSRAELLQAANDEMTQVAQAANSAFGLFNQEWQVALA